MHRPIDSLIAAHCLHYRPGGGRAPGGTGTPPACGGARARPGGGPVGWPPGDTSPGGGGVGRADGAGIGAIGHGGCGPPGNMPGGGCAGEPCAGEPGDAHPGGGAGAPAGEPGVPAPLRERLSRLLRNAAESGGGGRAAPWSAPRGAGAGAGAGAGEACAGCVAGRLAPPCSSDMIFCMLATSAELGPLAWAAG